MEDSHSEEVQVVVVEPHSVSEDFKEDCFVPEEYFEEEEAYSVVDSYSEVECSVVELGSAGEHSLVEYVAVLQLVLV